MDIKTLLQQLRKRLEFLQAWAREKPFQRRVRELIQARPYIQGIPYWTSGFCVGILAVFYSGAFGGSIRATQWLAEHREYFLFLSAPICLALSAWLVQRFAPEAGGTGIPRVTHALNLHTHNDCYEIHRILGLKTMFVVIGSSLIAVMGAGALGREGPMVHIGACVFYTVGKLCEPFFPQDDHRSWILAGGAAGVAAAFNAPLAGVVFVLEELSQQHFHRFKTQVITAAIVGGVVSQWLTGRYLFFGVPKIDAVPLSSLPWAIGLGILCGSFGYLFHRMASSDVRSRVVNFFGGQIRYCFFAGVMLAALAVFITPRTIGGGISLIEDLLFRDELRATALIIAGRFLATVITFFTGCSGGFLAPSLSLGAALGSGFAQWTSYPNHNLLVTVGMSAFLSTVIRAPFTAWVIVMEMTDRHSAIFPLMVASLVSYGTCRFYEEKRAKRLGKLESATH